LLRVGYFEDIGHKLRDPISAIAFACNPTQLYGLHHRKAGKQQR
jgi:hypothetical protein